MLFFSLFLTVKPKQLKLKTRVREIKKRWKRRKMVTINTECSAIHIVYYTNNGRRISSKSNSYVAEHANSEFTKREHSLSQLNSLHFGCGCDTAEFLAFYLRREIISFSTIASCQCFTFAHLHLTFWDPTNNSQCSQESQLYSQKPYNRKHLSKTCKEFLRQFIF